MTTTGHEIAMALRGAYLAMHRQADAALVPFGVTANQFVLLHLLAEEEGITQQELSRRASSDPNTIRPMLLALQKKGLVRRTRHPSDRRAWCVFLTASGRKCFREFWSGSEHFRQALKEPFSPEECRALLELLHRIVASMGSAGEPLSMNPVTSNQQRTKENT